MTIIYAVTPAALRLYSRTYHARSSTLQRDTRLMQFITCSIILVVGLAWRAAYPWSVVAAIPLAIICWVLTPQRMRDSFERRVLQLHSGPGAMGVVGSHTMTLETDGFVDQTEAGLNRVKWSAVTEVVSSPEQTLILVGNAAYIVTASLVASGSYSQFVETLMQARGAHA
jgi:hypothetical protein